MNLFVAISDVHISLKNLDVSITVLRQALNRARDLRIPLFIAGDLNDGKAIMRSEWVKALIDLFNEFSDVYIHVLVGNHDLDNKNSDSNSLYFLTALQNVNLIDETCLINFGDNAESRWGVIPYQHSNTEFLKQLEFMRESNASNIIIHQGIMSAFMGDYVVDESSVPPEAFAGFDIVLSGHYHRSQRVGENILYFGSPFTVNFGEANETKFIWVVGYNEIGEVYPKPELTDVRRHCQIEFTAADMVKAENPTATVHVPDGSLLKVVVKGTKEFVRSCTIDFFRGKYPHAASISLVAEIDKQSENRISADIIHSPLKVVDVYLEQSTTSHDKTELKNFLLMKCQDIFSKYSSVAAKNFKIISVEADEFLSFRNMNYKYVPMGLTLVEGFDEDLGVNTGAGKSTFMDAPVYGIFGETSKNLKSDEVLNRIHPRDLKVKTLLQGDDGVYSITRFRKHKEHDNDLFLTLPNGQDLRGKDNRETQKIIEQTIGCSFDVFLKSSYFTQFGSIDRFLSASDTDKKKLISEITDLSIYDEMLECIKKSIKADDESLTLIGNEIAKIESNVNMMKSQKINDEARINVWNSDHSDKVRNLQLHSANFDVEKQKIIDDLNREFATWDLNNKLKTQDFRIKSEKFESDIIERVRSNNDRIHQLQGELAEFEFKIKELEMYPTVSVADEKQKIQTKLDVIRQLEDKKLQRETENRSRVQSLDKLKTKINSELSKLSAGASTDCLYCHQTVSADHIHKHVEVYQNEHDAILADMNDCQNAINQITEGVKIKSDLQLKLSDLDKTEKQQYEIKYKIDLHKRSIAQANGTIESLQKANEDRPMNPYTDSIALTNQTVNPVQAKIDLAQAAVNKYATELENKIKETNPYLNNLTETEAKLKQLLSQQSDKEAECEKYKLSQALGNWWKIAVHVNIKSYLMDSCLESINTIANEYLQILFDGVLKFDISATTEKGSEVKEKINVTIINNGDECSYQSLSGGERCRICLAVNLSLAEVINKSFGMIFLDEILNGLDEAGKQQSMKLLKDLERKHDSIFVIDHAEGFKNLFNNSIMIKKRNKVSSIV